jgi:chemotaxis protein methyltransferase CheR
VNTSAYPSWAKAALSDQDFAALSAFIHDHCGIRYPPAKKITLEARLRRRLRACGLSDFSQYRPMVLGPTASADEVVHMIDEVTTNKTDFFREPAHFHFLTGEALGTLAAMRASAPSRPLSVWSAACSTGEEVFTLAMVLEDVAAAAGAGGARGAPFRYSILGTDISTEVLETARRAVYDESLIQPVPGDMRRRYLLQSRDKQHPHVRVVPALRAKVRFARLNLLTPFKLDAPADVIFCRNVLIYFDRATQLHVLDALCRQLIPGGYLFLGHSDSLTGLELPLVAQIPSVYRKAGPGVGRPRRTTRERR